jgi:hypothetical protein
MGNIPKNNTNRLDINAYTLYNTLQSSNIKANYNEITSERYFSSLINLTRLSNQLTN